MQADLFCSAVQAERISRDCGIAMSAANAERTHGGWHEQALAFFIDFVASTPHPFMSEDVRDAAELAGLPKPPDRRAWGAVVLAAAFHRKIIKRIGYGPQNAPGCHMSPKSIWKRS